MSAPLGPIVEAEIRERFPAADVAAVIARLERAVLPFGSRAAPSERPRVHLAIIKLAEGNLEKLGRAVEVAEQDWRDVLVASGFGNADWREAIARAGMRVP